MNTDQINSILRSKDSELKQRDQIIENLKLHINSIETQYQATLENQNRFESGDSTNHTKNNFDNFPKIKAELHLKEQKIRELTEKIAQDQAHHEKELKSLSRQLASEEYNSENIKKSLANSNSENQSQITKLQNIITSLNKDKSLLSVKNDEILLKNKKLIVRLETINKYMELLPTREEHISLEREKNDISIKNNLLVQQINDEKVTNAKKSATLKEQDDKIGQLIEIIQTLKLENLKKSGQIKKLEDEISASSVKLNNHERAEFENYKIENKNLKANLQKSIDLSNEASTRLANQTKEKEALHTDLRVEIAKERAVSETLRQALIDLQLDKENLVKNLQEKDREIEKLSNKIILLNSDLDDVADIQKSLDVIHSIKTCLDQVTHDISTIVQVIDRQILQNSDNDCENGTSDKIQDIQDVSRLLSCSVHNRGDVFKKKSSASSDLSSNSVGFATADVYKENGLDRERAYEVAKQQLDRVVQLQNDVDNLRLKLSDRWTDHLASNCQIQ